MRLSTLGILRRYPGRIVLVKASASSGHRPLVVWCKSVLFQRQSIVWDGNRYAPRLSSSWRLGILSVRLDIFIYFQFQCLLQNFPGSFPGHLF